MSYHKSIKIDEFVGEVLTHIDVNKANDEILLTTESGRQFVICHHQGCCENVNIVDTEGEWHTLIGKPILAAKHWECQSDTEYGGSATDTKLTFQVTDATVINKWHGESNGYYSESVDLDEIVAGDPPWMK